MARQVITLAAIAIVALAGCIQPQETPEAEPTPPTASTPTTMEACAAVGFEPTGGPSGQASVANYPGSFSYSGQTTAQTGKEVYVWQNPSEGALVSWGGQAATGDLTVTIHDACGVEVYKMSVGAMDQGGASEETQRGTAGDWYLTFEFTLYTGQMGLSVNSS